jgi:hypothetical protein
MYLWYVSPNLQNPPRSRDTYRWYMSPGAQGFAVSTFIVPAFCATSIRVG